MVRCVYCPDARPVPTSHRSHVQKFVYNYNRYVVGVNCNRQPRGGGGGGGGGGCAVDTEWVPQPKKVPTFCNIGGIWSAGAPGGGVIVAWPLLASY